MKILYTWTGYRELREAGKDYPEGKEHFDKHIASFAYIPKDPPKAAKGWVRFALKEYGFNKVVVLVDYTDDQSLADGKDFRVAYEKSFASYGAEVQIVPVVIPDKDDYADVYQKAKQIIEETSNDGEERYFLLDSGTHAMNVCWILLGKTLFEDGAHFLRNFNHGLNF